MWKVLIVVWKDLLLRKNHYVTTALEIFMPIFILFLANVNSFPEHGDVQTDYMDDTVDQMCVLNSGDFLFSIVYEPSNAITDEIMSRVSCHGSFSDVRPAAIDNPNVRFMVGVKFHSMTSESSSVPSTLSYELYPTKKFWKNGHYLWKDSTQSVYGYTTGQLKKILRLVHSIDYAFINMSNITSPEITFSNMDLFTRQARFWSRTVIAAFFFAFSCMVPPVISRIVHEKMSGAKELMLMMGVKRWNLWVAKLIDSMLVFTIIACGVICFLYIPIASGSHVLTTVSPTYIFILMMYGLMAVLLFLFFISCFFLNPVLAVYITQILWGIVFLFFLMTLTLSIKIPRSVRLLLCMLPHYCFLSGLNILLDFDFYGKTVKFGEKLSGDTGFLTLSDVFFMIGFDILFYSLLTWYLEQVNPGKYGISKPYGFCFAKSYWFPNRIDTSYSVNHHENNERIEDFEAAPQGLNKGISIANLTKEYVSVVQDSILALDNVSIDFYCGEISAVLGHNGAGKTTLFSIISGLTSATSGSVTIYGYDMAVNAEEARKSLGLCPQDDMLMGDLNVVQILTFYGMIKGLTKSQASLEAKEYIEKLKLKYVKRTPASKLSGGQKRKVSLAIALIGGSKVVILDEPTSGMDPEIRREIWEMLLDQRGSRTILLTTHFMEEADVLSDRVAIMNHGKIKCYGTPLYLKSKYGSGYTLSVVVNKEMVTDDLTLRVKQWVKSAKFKCENVNTIMYQLPENEIKNFPKLFSELKDLKKQHRIESYCVSFSTFEDAYLRISNDADVCQRVDVVDSSPCRGLNCTEEIGPLKVSSYVLPFYQAYALLLKKWIYFIRNITSFAIFSVIPLFLIIASLFVIPEIGRKIGKNDPSGIGGVQARFNYSLDLYPNSKILYSSLSDDRLTENFARLIGQSGSNVSKVSDVEEGIKNIYYKDFYVYAKELILGVEFSPKRINVLYNSDAVQMLPISLTLLYNSLLQSQVSDGLIITSINMKYSDRERTTILDFLDFSNVTNVHCSASDIPDIIGFQTLFYLIGPIKESVHGAKHLQLMTTSATVYWITHLVFDVMSFLVYASIGLLLYSYDDVDHFISSHAGEIFFAIFLWAVGLILVTYLIASFFESIGGASVLKLITYLCFTFLVYNLVRWEIWPLEIRYFHPSTIIKIGLHRLCYNEKDNYKTALALSDFFLFFCLIAKESQFLSNCFHSLMNRILRVDYDTQVEKDPAVKNHELHVRSLTDRGDFTSNNLIVDDLKRWYFHGFHPCPAVRGVSFAVGKGECFGLLGVNGAGKTSTFSMMTGAIPPSEGKAFVNGLPLFSPLQKRTGFRQIGYCPQNRGIIPTLTGTEVLNMFARLRGVPESRVKRETFRWMEELHLLEHSKIAVEKYSGGNQRKLSLGVALIGDSSVVFLDEPTSGVDPGNRQNIWKVISNLRKEEKCVVLTSHSMDECEAVCTRLAIMVNGRFRCIGETTTLKNVYGEGFTVQLKISSHACQEECKDIKKAMSSRFDPGCQLIDEHLTIFEYRITNKNIEWDELFSKLLAIKQEFIILESFTASATTLEQIFIYFARNS